MMNSNIGVICAALQFGVRSLYYSEEQLHVGLYTVPNLAPIHISLPKDVLVTCSKKRYVKIRRVLKIVNVIAMRRMNGCISYGWWW